jgi:hypothetical protein
LEDKKGFMFHPKREPNPYRNHESIKIKGRDEPASAGKT